MIPAMHITAWSKYAPWAEQRQIEQDLIISRAIVELFSHPDLNTALRFRGGTALNKLHFPEPLRYSEDIDLVRTAHGPIKQILDGVREALEPWLGKPRFTQSSVAPKLLFSVEAEDKSSPAPLRLKVEINTRETEAYDTPLNIPYTVDNPWFKGEIPVPTFSREEMLATKMRALLQRDKGRDLFDLSHALDVFDDLEAERVITYFQRYLEKSALTISRAQAEERMFRKFSQRNILADMRPLLTSDQAQQLTDEAMKLAFEHVFAGFIAHIPGSPWARTKEMTDRFRLQLA